MTSADHRASGSTDPAAPDGGTAPGTAAGTDAAAGTAVAVRDEDRVRALGALRAGVAQGRVSHGTFERRMEVVITARRSAELTAVLSDLPLRARRGRVVRTVGRVSAFRRRVRHAWQAERHPLLVLPAPGRYPMSVGRAPGSVLRLSDASVSRFHAQLHGVGGQWMLRDIGSANGTWVNGSRVLGAVPVSSGDVVRFGSVSYRICGR